MNEATGNEPTMNTAQRIVARERRARISHTIRELVAERQQVLVYYWDLTEVTEAEERDPVQQAELLKRFCQLLVDYIALGHFEIYQRVVEGQERRQTVREVADEVYATIAETTDALIDFNDKHDGNEAPENNQEFSADLSRVGKALSVRIDLEDRLLDALGKTLQ